MRLEEKLITIDGPSASGKGLASRNVALALGFKLLDSGLLYRAYGYLFTKYESHDQAIDAFNKLEISFLENKETLIKENNIDITASLRTQDIAQKASIISSDPITRENLLSIQRSFISEEGLVADGRDMGSVVFPNAKTKIFLTASIEERAQRRFLELQNKGQEVNMRDLIAEIEQRDLSDTNRSISPLVQPGDAEVIDTTLLNPKEVVDKILSVFRSNQSS
jgi:cytidylate kinase